MKFTAALGAFFLCVLSASSLQAAQPDSRFGVQTHFAQGWDPIWADIAAMRGVSAARDELYWNQVETQPGVYSFPAAFDAYMAALQRDQIAPLITLDFANPLYDGGNTPYTDAGIAAYANYAMAVLNHYGSQIRTVEIWNEYNGSFSAGPATNDLSGTYTRMLQAAYARIKAARPDVTVLGGATAGVPLPYWEKLMQAGALSSMDALSIHPYRYQSPPEGIENDIANLQALVLKYNGGKPMPIWVSEIGWQEQQSTEPGQLAIDDAVQAKFLVRAYALLLSAGVTHIDWYMLRDDQGVVMGLMDPTGTPKLSAYAFQVMTLELAGAQFQKKETAPGGVYSMLFTRPSGAQVRVIWALQPTSFPVSGETAVVNLSGNQLGTPGVLNLTDTPLFVEGPMQGLAAAVATSTAVAETEITDSSRDFSGTQGQNGWSYGVFVGANAWFQPLPNYNVSDWTAAWGGPYPYMEISPGDQHPSVWGNDQVSAVRRWTSNVAGTVHVVGQFQCGTQGDGVGIQILVNGQPIDTKLLGGGGQTSIVENFDFLQTVEPGTTIDFAVNPGPALDIDYDVTTFDATISLH